MEKLGKDQEQKVLNALESAIKLANAGEKPSDAIYKVASEEKMGQEFVRRMVEAFNVSKTLHHLQHAGGTEKGASFDLANADDIIDRMWPKDVEAPAPLQKAASDNGLGAMFLDDDLMKLGTSRTGDLFEKITVEEYQQDPEIVANKWYDRRSHFQKAASTALSDYGIQCIRFTNALLKVAEHFRNVDHEDPTEFAEKVLWRHGAVGKHVVDFVKGADSSFPDIDVDIPERPRVCPHRSPYTDIDDAVSAVHSMVDHAEKQAQAEMDLVEWETNSPFEKAAVLEKQAIGLGIPEAVSHLHTATSLAQSGGMLPDSASGKNNYEAGRQQILDDLFDPSDELEFRKARTQILMNDMLSNDPIIASYDQDKVVSAYNQLVQLAPQAAQQPIILRSLLRKLLTTEGGLEDFDIKSMTDVEKDLRTRSPLPPSLTQVPGEHLKP